MNFYASPSDPITLVTEAADIYDTGFAGVPFEAVPVPVLQWVYLLLAIGWIGLLLLTGYCIKVNPASKLPEVDTDTLIILVAWAGLLILTAYTLRILHGP